MELKYTPYRHLSFKHFTFPPVIYLIHPTTLWFHDPHPTSFKTPASLRPHSSLLSIKRLFFFTITSSFTSNPFHVTYLISLKSFCGLKPITSVTLNELCVNRYAISFFLELIPHIPTCQVNFNDKFSILWGFR